MSNHLIGYQPGQGFLYDLSGASKMSFLYLGFSCLYGNLSTPALS